MRLTGKKLLQKLKNKNKGNIQLTNAVDTLIKDIENSIWTNSLELHITRADADCVHNSGFYIFNIAVHRTMVLVEFEEIEATVVWVGNHNEYEKTFRNNKNTIKKWLKSHGWIE